MLNILKVIEHTSLYTRSLIRKDKSPNSCRYHPVDGDKESRSSEKEPHKEFALQVKVHGPYLPNVPLPKIIKQKKRRATMTQNELPVYIAVECIGTQPLLAVSISTDENNQVMESSRYKFSFG